jgi:hypothetical protein
MTTVRNETPWLARKPAKVMALHDTCKSFTNGRSYHIHILTMDEMLN